MYRASDALGKARGLLLQTASHFLTKALSAEATNALAQQRIGNASALGESEQSGSRTIIRRFIDGDDGGIHEEVLFGNHGNNIGVLRWYSR